MRTQQGTDFVSLLYAKQEDHSKSLLYAKSSFWRKFGEWKSRLRGRRQIQTHDLIQLTHQKDANLILTRKCFTIAIKTIQLSSHIIKHDEFIKATFSSEQLFETTYLLLEAKTPSYFITCMKRKNSIVSNMRNIATN